MRIRIKYSIFGKLRFISHLDLMRAFFRACIKKDIPVAVSQGFSPHLKISFGPSLSLGTSSNGEYLDIYLSKNSDLETLRANLQEGLPNGIRIKEVKEVMQNVPSLSANISRAVYSIKIPQDKTLDINERIKLFSNALVNSVKGRPAEGTATTALGRSAFNGVKKIELKDNRLFLDVPMGNSGTVRPIDVLKALWPELDLDELKLWQVNREELYSEETKNLKVKM